MLQRLTPGFYFSQLYCCFLIHFSTPLNKKHVSEQACELYAELACGLGCEAYGCTEAGNRSETG